VKAIFFGSLVAAIFALVGGILVNANNETAGYGVTMFIILPVATGFVTACFLRTFAASLLAALLSVLIYVTALLFIGLEGIICVFMALPLILAGSGIGALFGLLALGLTRDRFDDRLHAFAGPILAACAVLGSTHLEGSLGTVDRVEDFTTTREFNATPEQMWQALLNVDNVEAPKPFLLQIGLPVPRRCTLEGSGPGAVRICYFDSGIIEEVVTVWDPPHHLGVRITRSTLPGRHWLGFVEASYEIKQIASGKTLVKRVTTISSKLRPAWYWRVFEDMGVQAEHHYLFASLKPIS
jgi:hypothetical protein